MLLLELSRVDSLMYSEHVRIGRILFWKGAVMVEEGFTPKLLSAARSSNLFSISLVHVRGRLRVAQQFTAGTKASKTRVRKADG